VITNQAGIGRGLYTEAEFAAFSAWIDERLAEVGAHVDATYHCPHHPTAGIGEYLTACDCRKPAPGMLLRAIRDWDVDVAASVMIGDKPHDIAAAEAAGVRGLLFEGGDLDGFVREALG
jgi:D-glycero-D-manno-heptose 1,7-bisphosphate phosphatase